jgi:hypothetical protein
MQQKGFETTPQENVHGGIGEKGIKLIVLEEGEMTKDCRKGRIVCS